jgi:hypothetical protein
MQMKGKIPCFARSRLFLVCFTVYSDSRIYTHHFDVDGVHHYDENGLRNLSQEPVEIRKIHEEMIAFVKKWLEDWPTRKQ